LPTNNKTEPPFVRQLGYGSAVSSAAAKKTWGFPKLLNRFNFILYNTNYYKKIIVMSKDKNGEE
jgi:hypothetical protein